MRTLTRLRRRLARARLLRRWWVWLLAVCALWLVGIGLLRWLLHDHLIVATVHDERGVVRVVVYPSILTEFASGGDRLVVTLGRWLLPPELAIEGWVRTRLR